jgi:hypothetical protein
LQKKLTQRDLRSAKGAKILSADNFFSLRRQFYFCAHKIFLLCAQNFSAVRKEFSRNAASVKPGPAKAARALFIGKGRCIANRF